MSGIAHDFFAASPLLALPILSLFVFASVFFVIAWRAMRAPAEAIDTQAALPLQEDLHD